MITHKQFTLAEVFEDYQNKFDNDKYQFLSLLDEAINLDEIVPVSFISHFYAYTERPRKHQLYPMLKVLLIQRIFSIPTDTLLIVFLKYSQDLRDFCGFDVVPDGSKFTCFKQDFLMELQSSIPPALKYGVIHSPLWIYGEDGIIDEPEFIANDAKLQDLCSKAENMFS